MSETAEHSAPIIAYVDELDDARASFFTDAYQSGLFADIVLLAPEKSLDEMVEQILDLRIDALISDFELTQAGPVDYDGEALVDAILARRAGFPCFIQTSFDDAALKVANDVNRVYSKNPKASRGGREEFLQRIVLQVERHRTRMAAWIVELEQLLAVKRDELTAAQVERMIELDSAIENNMGSDASIARETKHELLTRTGVAARHSELMTETEKLLSEMRRALGEQ